MIETVRLYIRWTVSFLLHFIRKKFLETDIRDREMRLRGKLLWRHQKKIDILEHIIAAVAGAYYNINLTRNLVPGQMYQVVDGKEYNVNEMTGLPADAKFSEVIDYWGKRLSEKEKEAYYAFLIFRCF